MRTLLLDGLFRRPLTEPGPGPGDAALDHTPNEHIVLEEFRRGVAVLSESLIQLPALIGCPIEALQAL